MSMKLLSPFKHDLPFECAGFFTAFRMTDRRVFCHSERAFGRGRISTVITKITKNPNGSKY